MHCILLACLHAYGSVCSLLLRCCQGGAWSREDALDKIVEVLHGHAGDVLDLDVELPGSSCILLLDINLHRKPRLCQLDMLDWLQIAPLPAWEV